MHFFEELVSLFWGFVSMGRLPAAVVDLIFLRTSGVYPQHNVLHGCNPQNLVKIYDSQRATRLEQATFTLEANQQPITTSINSRHLTRMESRFFPSWGDPALVLLMLNVTHASLEVEFEAIAILSAGLDHEEK